MALVSTSPTVAENAIKLAPLPDPLDPQDKPPLDRYCDLVLKGGVVDGVIYPGVLIELARKFRFQSLAGTSVGAIAAALAAASEYARRFGSDHGFNEVLRKVPDELAEDSRSIKDITVIRSLFQTKPELNRFFSLIVDLLSADLRAPKAKDKLESEGNPEKGPSFLCALISGLFTYYRHVLLLWFLSGAALAFFLAPWVRDVVYDFIWAYANLKTPLLFQRNFESIWQLLCSEISTLLLATAALMGLFGALIGLILALIRDYSLLTGQPGFGFCSGLSEDGGKTEGLTEWLHRGIQGAAGLNLSRPLTFQDLWDAPGGPKVSNASSIYKSIDLRMMTTCVSHGRPYEMPLIDQSVRLFFKLEEWTNYFPPSIREHLKSVSVPYTRDRLDIAPGSNDGNYRNPDVYNSPNPGASESTELLELPVGALPVLVAVRLSMNFPILFQAVPLWAIDHEGGRVEEVIPPPGPPNLVQAFPKFKKAWFADGGVTANFPLHVFDTALPSWPTFGVFIKERSRKAGKEENAFYIAEYHTSGRSEKWHEIDEEVDENSGFISRRTGFFDYVVGLGKAAKDWADNANLRMPSVRGRVVTVFHKGLTNGGLNLKIEGLKIRHLAYVNGTTAGRNMANKFTDQVPEFNQNLSGNTRWLDHRWVRFNTYVTALKSHIAGFTEAANNAHGTSPLRDQIREACNKEPLYFEDLYEPKLTITQAQALSDAVDAIEKLEASLTSDRVVQPYVARPQYELKPKASL